MDMQKPTISLDELVIVHGAMDPEMAAISSLAKEAGIPLVAGLCDGKPVHPGNAYRVDGFSEQIDPSRRVIAIECDGPAVSSLPEGRIARIDHHRPGDPGFGAPPERYWEASSVGQFCHLFGIEPTEELRHVAAADHCLSAAYKGLCPGVDPDKLMEWRITSRAKFQGKDPAVLMATVKETMSTISSLAQEQNVEPGGIVSLLGTPDGTLPEAPEAASRLSYGVECKVKERDGREKLVLMGSATPESVSSWLDAQKEQGREVYGDPRRGFAGAYLPQPTMEMDL